MIRMLLRVTKTFTFEMAHALGGHDGPCRHVHGHSYELAVTVRGMPSQEKGHPKNGMVIDFSELKAIVNKHVIHPFDHTLVLPAEADEYKHITGEAVIRVPYQPTCENLLAEFVQRLQPQFPQHMQLVSLRLRETATSWAEWLESEQDEE